MTDRLVPAILAILLVAGIAAWMVKGATVAVVLSLAGAPGCF